MSRFGSRSSAVGRGGAPDALPDCAFLPARYPVIWEYLTVSRYDDGKPRTRATLLLLVEQGRVKVSLNDRDCSRALWIAGEGTLEALAAMEEELGGSGPDWRVYAAGGKSAKK